MTIRYDEELGRDITYYDLCGSTCDLNELLWTTESMAFFGLSYPVTSLFVYQSNIGKHFYKVNTSSSGDLRSAKVAMLVYMAFYQTKEVKADLSLYEKVVQRAVEEHNAGNHTVTFTLHGEGGMNVSKKRDSLGNVPFSESSGIRDEAFLPIPWNRSFAISYSVVWSSPSVRTHFQPIHLH